MVSKARSSQVHVAGDRRRGAVVFRPATSRSAIGGRIFETLPFRSTIYVSPCSSTPKLVRLFVSVWPGLSWAVQSRGSVAAPPTTRSDLMKPGQTLTNSLTRSEEHTSELQSRPHLACRLLL